MKRLSDYLFVTVKGICMGAADVIPGVSGGTIAFMTGIYEELVGSINSINGEAVKLLFSGKFKAFWKHINGNFLLSLVAGILISILSLAKLMTYLLTNHPIQTWAFFFGLIVASSIFILKGINGWKFKDIVMLILGIIIGIVVCTLTPTQTPDGLWFIFICGAIAICAMILPGISGSFILLILGKYEYMLGTITKITSGDGRLLDFAVILIFVVGALIGILSFSRFLHWLLARYHRATLLVLAGFIIGSLVKVWPWSDMATVAASQHPELAALPSFIWEDVAAQYSGLIDYHIGGAVCFALVGFVLVVGIELVSNYIGKKRGSSPDNGNAIDA
jgi:putative membrane protein